MSNIGNINYSLNKNDINKIISGYSFYFIPNYYFLIILSIVYIFSIRIKKYYYHNQNNKKEDADILHYFHSITTNSPFHILEMEKYHKDIEGNNKNQLNYTGLNGKSYCFIIISYVITLIIILEGLIRNFIYSIYVNFIQINPKNNPYNNSNCIQKVSDSAYASTAANYFAIVSLSLLFLFPFIVPYLISFLKFDNYDIKHNTWFRYVILFLIFYPIIIVLISKSIFYKKLEIFSSLNYYLTSKDYSFTNFLSENFALKIFPISIFLFIIFVYCYYQISFAELKYSFGNKIKIYTFIYFLLFIFLPIFLIMFGLAFLFNNKDIIDPNKSTINSINDEIKNNKSVNGIYEVLVKYNYPCFMK